MSFEHRRKIQSQHRQLDSHQHHQRARCPIRHTAVWTGSEMIVWGGCDGFSCLNTGGRYNPSTDSWTATSTTNAPAARYSHTAVWTGSEMIVWGGYDGWRFEHRRKIQSQHRQLDSHQHHQRARCPKRHTAVWTEQRNDRLGRERLATRVYLNTGGRYNPGTDSWTATSTTNAPAARWGHTAVWTGSEMIVWGGGS